MKRDDNELERVLDRSLHEYSEVSARDGLEQRILANLAASPEKTRRWWAWAVVPASAVVMVVGVLWVRLATEIPAPPITISATPTAPNLTSRSARVVTASKRRNSRRTAPQVTEVARAEPRLATFPSQPDEPQARMLLQFVQGSPRAAEQVVKEEEEFKKLVAENFEGSTNPEQELETR